MVLGSLSVATEVDQDGRFMTELTLPQNSLGRTGVSVTKLGYGAMEVRGPRIWGGRPIEDGEAEQILNAVLDNGITFIDTANDYGWPAPPGFEFTAACGQRSLPLPRSV
jgi:hypothetical protein